MSGHRRIKDVGYDDDDFDEGEDDEYYAGEGGEEEEGLGGDEQQGEMSAEDEEQMAIGTVAVQEQLGPDIKVSVKAIQDALWYYYYDVEKSVAYLRKQHTPAEPKEKKQKPPSKFDQAAAAAAKAKPATATNPKAFKQPGAESRMSRSHGCPRYLTASEFFRDTPWLNVPDHRRGNLVPIEPLRPRVGGLLGGSGKPSKLAALAAARRKEREEKKAKSDEHPSSSSGTSGSVALLDKLTTRSKPVSELNAKVMTESKAPIPDTFQSSILKKPTSNAVEEKEATSSKPEAPHKLPPSPERNGHTSWDMKTQPSGFAKTIIGHTRRLRRQDVADGGLFTLEYDQNTQRSHIDPFLGPSPDDIVTNAQSKAKETKANGNNAKADASKSNGITNGMSAMKVSEAPPKLQRKALDVVAEYRKLQAKQAANFVVIGHVDHGKSTLMGRLLYDLKIVNQRSVDKLRKEADSTGKSSFALAWVMDSTPEERQRGITVDIASQHFETEKTRFTILDAPGHRDFIPNMIAGAAQADFAVLVIDASTNAYEAGLKGQTKEHALLARSIGISRIIVAVNKMDATNWSQERFQEIQQQMTAFLQSAGFQNKNLTFIPCAGLTGENVASKPTDGNLMPWYDNGPCLVDALDACEPAARSIEEPLRMTIADVFRGGVQNPVSISGRIDTGSLQVGDTLLAMPSGERAHIKGIEVDSKGVEWAVAGQIPTLHLADIDPSHLRSGDIVCDPQRSPIRNVKRFTAKILAFEHILPGALDVHRGRLHTPAKISEMISIIGKTEGEVLRKKPKVIKPGQVARMTLELDAALPLEGAARIVLRSEGATIGAGLVERPPETPNDDSSS